MNDIECQINRLIKASVSGFRPSVEISVDLHDKMLGYTGTWAHGLFKRRVELEPPFPSGSNFTDLLRKLREESKRSELGPIYKCVLSFAKGKTSFVYGYENSHVTSIDELMLTRRGDIPTFYLKKFFSEEVINFTPESSIPFALANYVKEAVGRGKDVRSSLLRAYAVGDWLFSAERYGVEGYFRQEKDSCELFKREQLFEWVLQHMDELGDSEGKEIFEEGLAMCSHRDSELEDIRKRLGTAWTDNITIQENDTRFVAAHDRLEKKVSEHIKNNPSQYADEG